LPEGSQTAEVWWAGEDRLSLQAARAAGAIDPGESKARQAPMLGCKFAFQCDADESKPPQNQKKEKKERSNNLPIE
jgi:hypothetical protein